MWPSVYDHDPGEKIKVMKKDSVHDGVDMRTLFEAIFETRFELQENEYHYWKANCQIFAAKVFNLIAANKKHVAAVDCLKFLLEFGIVMPAIV